MLVFALKQGLTERSRLTLNRDSFLSLHPPESTAGNASIHQYTKPRYRHQREKAVPDYSRLCKVILKCLLLFSIIYFVKMTLSFKAGVTETHAFNPSTVEAERDKSEF